LEEDKKGTMSKTEILLFSGGVDSYVAWLKLGRPPTIHFMGVSRYSAQEYSAVRMLQSVEPELSPILFPLSLNRFEQEGAWIPARNMLFVTIAAYAVACVEVVYKSSEKACVIYNLVEAGIYYHWTNMGMTT